MVSPKSHVFSNGLVVSGSSSLYLAVALAHVLLWTAASSSTGCTDNHNDCKYWSSIGECDKNPNYMHFNCKLSCDTCTAEDVDLSVERSVGISRQDVSGVWWMNSSDTQDFLEEVVSYMKDEVWSSPQYFKTRGVCTNKYDLCSHWAMEGRCDEVGVKLGCGPSCKSCMFLDENVRCGGTLEQLPNALFIGSLDTMFQRIVSDYDVRILSQPTPEEEDKPWMVTIDDFVSDEEIDRILEYGQKTGYQPATETFHGNHGAAEKTQARTSETSWCGYQMGDTCFEDPIIKGLLSRVRDVTNVPIANYNEMQILKYAEGQYYHTHGDYIVQDTHRRAGGRILTFFLYLNDVEEGGETEFPRLSPPIKVTPKKGTALLWANVLDSDPFKEDTRMWHQALPVVKGRKQAANLWIHMRDSRTPTEYRCYD